MPGFPFGSGPAPGSASARDAGALKHLEIKAYCGVISAEQEAILACAKFLGGEEEDEGEEAQVVITPPVIRLQNEELTPQVEQVRKEQPMI